MRRSHLLVGLLLLLTAGVGATAPLLPGSGVISGHYLQEFGRTYTAIPELEGKDIRGLAVDSSDAVWVGTREGLYRYFAGQLSRITAEPLVRAEVLSLGPLETSVWAATRRGLYPVSADGSVGPGGQGAPAGVNCLRVSEEGLLHASVSDGVWQLREGKWVLLAVPTRAINGFALGPAGVVWLASKEGLWRGSGWEWRRFTARDSPLLSDDVRAVERDASGQIWVGTAQGLNLVSPDGEGWRPAYGGGEQGLPWPDVLALYCAGNETLLIGTARGCAKLERGQWRFYHSLRWLPNDCVRVVARQKEGTLWMGTRAGLARVEFRDFTLGQKADFFLKAIRERHLRHGFVADCIDLGRAGDVSAARPAACANDGLYTSLYVAAESFRYAVSGEEAAHLNAWESAEAMISLQEATGVPGLIARTIWFPGEPEAPLSTGEWHDLRDGRKWRGEASSDELAGHFFGLSVFHDRAAREEEKTTTAAAIKALMDHLIAHDYNFVDVDGKPTKWGVFAPASINDDPKWEAERSLSSLELLSFLKTTYHVTGQELYQQKYLDLVQKHGYASNTLAVRRLPSDIYSYTDHQLILLSFYPLLSYESDPELRATYEAALLDMWQQDRSSRCPTMNIFASALLKRPLDLEVALRELQDIPVDMIRWAMNNSWRQDLRFSSPPRDGPGRLQIPVPAQERPPNKIADDPHSPPPGEEGVRENAPTYWLLPYWCARYHGLIVEEEAR